MNISAIQARQHLENGDNDIARRVIISALEKSPDSPDCWLVMGMIQANTRDYDYAAQSLEKYLQCLEEKYVAL